MKFVTCVVFSLFITTSFSRDLRSKRQARKCEDSCILLKECDPFLTMLRNKDPNAKKVIKENRCGREGARMKVCCPEMSDFHEILFPDDCGNNPKVANKIIGGEETQMGEFPWVAALEYKKPQKRHSKIMCAGSLINSRYVLTAAHCVDRKKSDGYELYKLRLGEWNLTSNPDYYESQVGRKYAQPYITVRPEKIIPHPMYDIEHAYAHDIALIRLDETINFTDAQGYILPICLPSFGIRTELLANKMPIVIGWGRTREKAQNDVLLKAELPFAPRSLCTRYFYTNFRDKQLCVGGGEKDSCDGDSGSPLMLQGPEGPPYLQIGIVSYGTLCGAPNIPAVYTSVSHYKNWITYNMENW